MNIFEEIDFADDSSTTGVLAVGTPVSGNIQSESDVDWLRTALQAGTTYIIDLSGDNSGNGTLRDPELLLFDASGSIVASNDDGPVGLDSRLVFSPETSGDYFVAAQSLNFDETGTYLAELTEIEGDIPGSNTTTAELTLDTPTTSAIDFQNDDDWFQLNVVAGTIYNVEAMGEAVNDFDLTIYDGTGDFIASNFGFDGSVSSSFAAQQSGTYFVSARAFDTTGQYTLTATELGVDDCADDPTTTCELALDTPTNGEIQFDNDQDWLQLSVEAGEVYTIEMDSTQLNDWDLLILDEFESFVTSGFGSEFDGPATASFQAEQSGTYFVSASSFSNQGAYTLTATQLGVIDIPGNNTTTAELTLDTPTTSAIDFQNDDDWFQLNVVAGTIYNVEAVSYTHLTLPTIYSV